MQEVPFSPGRRIIIVIIKIIEVYHRVVLKVGQKKSLPGWGKAFLLYRIYPNSYNLPCSCELLFTELLKKLFVLWNCFISSVFVSANIELLFFIAKHF